MTFRRSKRKRTVIHENLNISSVDDDENDNDDDDEDRSIDKEVLEEDVKLETSTIKTPKSARSKRNLSNVKKQKETTATTTADTGSSRNTTTKSKMSAKRKRGQQSSKSIEELDDDEQEEVNHDEEYVDIDMMEDGSDDYNDDDYEEEDDEDDEDDGYDKETTSTRDRKRSRKNNSHNNTDSPKSKTKRGRKSMTSSSSDKKTRDYGSIEDRTCPFCQKVFSIVTGLAYHIEHKVCQKEGGLSKNKSSKKYQPGSFPFPKIQPHSKFVTPYGVVQVLSDSRIPSDHNSTCIPQDIKDLNRVYLNKKDRIQKRKTKQMLYNAKIQRKRRYQLLQHYLEEKKKHEEENNGESDKEIKLWNGNSASFIWNQYCTLSTPSDILSGKYNQALDHEIQKHVQIVEKHPWNDTGDDPMIPADSYPDRIVECVLINDERMKICNIDIQAEGEERLTKVESARKAVEEAKKKKQEETDDSTSSIEQNFHVSKMKLFLPRKMLIHSYNEKIPRYQCQNCGAIFNSRVGLKCHIDELICVKRPVKRKQERANRLKEIEDGALATVINGPPLLTPTSKDEQSSPSGVSTGNKTKRKKHKKWPAWLEFYPALSPIYPEIFDILEFKRGSNNSKFISKKYDDPGRKRARQNRSKKSVPLSAVKDEQSKTEATSNNNRSENQEIVANKQVANESMPPLPPLPSLPSSSFPIIVGQMPTVSPLSTPLPIPSDVAAASPLIQQRTMAKAPPLTKQTTTTKKKKRKSTVANPKPQPSTPVIVDIRPLVEEIRAGRYPSMKEYNGDHIDICFVCKNKGGDDLRHCEFCDNTEHLSCVQCRVTIRDLEPDDEFMCHRCIQTVLARRARAEKRRLQKLDEAMGGGSTGTNGNANNGDSKLEEAKAATAAKHEIVWNQTDFDQHIESYKKCPSGGPGGLICCGSCTTAYSRLLSETSKEMDSQTVSSIGREVSELVQLLEDAKRRLKQSVDVSVGNDIRMSLLNKNQVSFDTCKSQNQNMDDSLSAQNGHRMMGFMDIFNNNIDSNNGR